MSETTARIRWHHVDGTVVEWFGHVGTVTATALFQILHPVVKPTEDIMGRRFDEWALCTTFPGSTEQVRYGGRDDGAQDRLKAEAERWLEEFVKSLGATLQGGKCECVISLCECGGLAHHKQGCRWREGYGSRVIAPADQVTAATTARAKE